MKTKNLAEYEVEGGACPHCGRRAELRTCVECGKQDWIIGCGHYDQPRPIAAGRKDGTELYRTFCEDCA